MTCAGGSGATPSRAAAHPTKSQFAAQAHDARELYRDLWPARACEGGKTTASGVKESTDTCCTCFLSAAFTPRHRGTNRGSFGRSSGLNPEQFMLERMGGASGNADGVTR